MKLQPYRSGILVCLLGMALAGCVSEPPRTAPTAASPTDTNRVAQLPAASPPQSSSMDPVTLATVSPPAAPSTEPARVERTTVKGRVTKVGPFDAAQVGEGTWLLLEGNTLVYIPTPLSVKAARFDINIGSRIVAEGAWTTRGAATYFVVDGIRKE